MNNYDLVKAELEKLACKAKPCPFCGMRPRFEFKIKEPNTSQSNKFFHLAKRDACCRATGLGQTELFFDESKIIETWRSMSKRLIADWNDRH